MCKLLWTHWDLSPGPSACEADVIPLQHVPLKKQLAVAHTLHIRLAIQTLQMSIMENCLSCAFRKPWMLTKLQTSMLADQTHLLHIFGDAQNVSGLVAVIFFANKICGLELRPYSRTACPVSCYTCYTHSMFQLLSGFMAAGLPANCHGGQESGYQL